MSIGLLDGKTGRTTHRRDGGLPSQGRLPLLVSTFGEVIRKRRRKLNFTQRELADRVGVSKPFIGHLERSRRRPSDHTVRRLADVLGLDQGELLLAANPETAGLLRRPSAGLGSSAWDEFCQSYLPDVEPQEIDLLSKVASMGRVRSPSDYLYVLNSVRHALGRGLLDLVGSRSDGSPTDVESFWIRKSARTE